MLKKVITYVIAIVGVLSLIPSIIVISNSASNKKVDYTFNTVDISYNSDLFEYFMDSPLSVLPKNVIIDDNVFTFDRVDKNNDMGHIDLAFIDDIGLESVIMLYQSGDIVLNGSDEVFPDNIDITITYQVPQNNLISTLLALIPLVIISGLLGYLLLFNNKENE